MYKQVRLYFICLFFFQLHSAHTQSNYYLTYKKNPYDWTEIPIKYEETNDTFKRFDAYIVDEKVEYYFFSQHVQVHNHIKYKANTSKGINKIKTLSLPHHFSYPDEMYYDPEEMRDTLIRPLIRDVEIVRFGARIIKPDGKVLLAEINDYTKSISIANFTQVYTIYNYFFEILNLEPNDILEIDYLYNIPHKENFAGYSVDAKINFVGLLPKKNFECKLAWDLKTTVVYVTGFNGAENFDTIKNYKTNKLIYTWRLDNFLKVANESNSNLYKETPYIKFYYPYYINSPSMNYRRPMQWYDLLNFKYNTQKNNIIDLDPEINAIEDLYKKYKYKNTDTSILDSLWAIHHYVNYELKYKSDSAYYTGDDKTLSRIDLFLKNKVFKNRSRERFYTYLFDASKADYFIGILPDKRMDFVNINQVNNIDEPMYFYVLNYNNKPYYFYPKLFDYGYHVNEFPFYAENQSTLLIKQNVNDIYNPKNYIEHQTPVCLKTDNYRNIKSQIEISLLNNNVSINTNITLSGQMSTMCRHSYSTNYINPFANSKYGVRVYDLGVSHLINQKIKNELDVYPFKVEYEIEYQNDLIIKKDNQAIIAMNRLILPITPYKLEDVRTTTFYSDFLFKDSYRYLLHFDVSALIDEKEESFENSYGRYYFSIKKVDDKSYAIIFNYQIITEIIPSEKYEEVKSFYEALDLVKNKMIPIH